jgi:hypothetical protein
VRAGWGRLAVLAARLPPWSLPVTNSTTTGNRVTGGAGGAGGNAEREGAAPTAPSRPTTVAVLRGVRPAMT